MPLTSGTRLGSYEILEPIGAGGMGEVYRARDTKLDRDVAIKVLPEEFASDPERLSRFEREAKLLASLNHPNIASIHGFEESDGINALVLELVEGPTLAERIEQGPIPVEEATAIAKQIAEALEAGHETGVIHRDLKPANIKLKEDGTVKVLDYGLAKVFESNTPSGTDSKLSQSPTLARQGTQVGVILGTAAYMSPEQARGKRVDKRTDIWAFGCCLYEALTGKPAFLGDTSADTLSNVLQREPDWRDLPEDSAVFQALLRRCLAKDPDRRLHDIADARLEIDDIAEAPPVAGSVQKRSRPTSLVPLVAALLLGGAFVGLINRMTDNTTRVADDVIRYSFALPEETTLWDPSGFAPPLAISNDGKRIVFAATSGDGPMLYVRTLDSFEATPIPGTEGSGVPFFSPDGESVGFLEEDMRLSRISLSGGNALVLYQQERGRGASWGADDSIVYAGQFRGLLRIPASGGDVEPLTTFGEGTNEINHRWPQFLPDGKHVLFTVSRAQSQSLEVLSLETGERRVLLEGDTILGARFVPPGHLVFAQSGDLLAVRCDPVTLEILGSPVRVLEGVNTTSRGSAHFAVSAAGTLVYAPGSAASDERSLVWVDREGRETSILAGDAYEYPRLSPDGQSVVTMIHQENGNHEIWMLNVERGSRRLVYARGDNYRPVWTRDGTRVTFSSRQGTTDSLHWTMADGSGEIETLLVGETSRYPSSWSPDGKTLAYTEFHPDTEYDIWLLTVDGGDPVVFLRTPAREHSATFSPDGEWIAYVSDESGQNEVYAQRFRGQGAVHTISTDGGEEPLWSRDEREIYYRKGSQVFAVTIEADEGFSAGESRLLFEGDYWRPSGDNRTYDFDPDSQRFLMLRNESAPTQLNVVVNWAEELKRLVPTQ